MLDDVGQLVDFEGAVVEESFALGYWGIVSSFLCPLTHTPSLWTLSLWMEGEGKRTLRELLELRHRPRDATPDLRRAPRELGPPRLLGGGSAILGLLRAAEQGLALRAGSVGVPLLLHLREHRVEL